MKVLVTGSAGFVGKNLLARLARLAQMQVLPITRSSTATDLERAAREADFVVHLAGTNRPQHVDEFAAGNIGFAQALCAALGRQARPIPIIYASSTQAERENPYGASKRGAELVIEQYAAASGSPAFIYRLPNVFGKWGRPDYNSVVATFCHNIANNLPISIHDPAVSLSLVYVDDVVDSFIAVLAEGRPAGIRPQVEPVFTTTVGDLARTIGGFPAIRTELLASRVGTGLIRALYATYVSYLPTSGFSYGVQKHEDPRGVFVEMLKTPDSGQFSYFTAHPGITRGRHYHHTKTEKFLVITGKARFRFRHILTNETCELLVSGDQPRIVDSVPGWAHDITNIGDGEMVVMLWANEIFDRQRPDTYSHAV